MNRLDTKIAAKTPLLTCYFPVGDPLVPMSMLDVYAEAGVDIVELGVPSADPFMDGTDVADAMRRALNAGNGWPAYKATAAYLRRKDDGPAAICMCYPDLDFASVQREQAWRDVDGLLMVGLSTRPDRPALEDYASQHDIRMVGFIDSQLNPPFVEDARHTSSYIMLQAAPGATGPRHSLTGDNADKVARVKAQGLTQPVLLGFGISTAEQAQQAVALGADGVIIGSMCIRAALQGEAALRKLLTEARTALDG